MVQSEVEVIKLNALFQKVLYKWLEGLQYPWFKVELDTSSMYLLGYTQELTFVLYRDNKLPRCSVSLRKLISCPYDSWTMGVADYEFSSSIRFYGRGKLLSEFTRKSINTQQEEWYPYVSEILDPLNESQRFSLEIALQAVLKELEKEIEFREGLNNG